jgi:hypothetical protein
MLSQDLSICIYFLLKNLAFVLFMVKGLSCCVNLKWLSVVAKQAFVLERCRGDVKAASESPFCPCIFSCGTLQSLILAHYLTHHT